MASATPPRTPCWHCKHMLEVDARSSVVRCGHKSPGRTSTCTHGRTGCGDWEREPGIDDDDWDPPGSPRINPDAVVEAPVASSSRSRGTDGWWTEPRRPPRPPVPPAPRWTPPARDPFGGIYAQDDD